MTKLYQREQTIVPKILGTHKTTKNKITPTSESITTKAEKKPAEKKPAGEEKKAKEMSKRSEKSDLHI